MCHGKNKYLFFALVLSILIALVDSLKPFGYVSLFSTVFIILSVFSITIYNLEFLFETDIDLSSRIG